MTARLWSVMCLRYTPIYRKVKELLDAGTIGDVVFYHGVGAGGLVPYGSQVLCVATGTIPIPQAP